MRAEIITIGDELLIGQVVDTNSAWMGERLNEAGIELYQITSVHDDREHILKALDEALQAIYTMFEEITPATQEGYFAYFVYKETTPIEEQQAECETNANKREVLYKLVSRLVCRYIDIANEMQEAGYSDEEAAKIKNEVEDYNSLKDEIKLKSGDGIDLKLYDPAMRRLIDSYVRAEDSEVLADLSEMSFLELIDERGDKAIDSLPKRIKKNERSVAEVLAANMRKIIINERPTNPAYFDKMSELLNALLKQQKDGAISYKKLIDDLVAKIKEMHDVIHRVSEFRKKVEK